MLPEISIGAHLMWVLNWCYSDDKGVFENDAQLIKSNVFPRRNDIRLKQIRQWLDQLEKARFIVPLKFANKSYFINRTFDTHQRIDKPQPSKIPAQVIKNTLAALHSENVPGTILAVLDSKVLESNGEGVSPPEVFLKKNSEEEESKKAKGKRDAAPRNADVNAGKPEKFSDVLDYFDTKAGALKWDKGKISMEAQKFFNHYEGSGWKVSGHLIVNWMAKANEWLIRAMQGAVR